MFDVHVQDQPLKTPQGRLFKIPSLALTKEIEKEWKKDRSPSFQKKTLTSLAATALDQVADSRGPFTHYALQSISRDVLLFWAQAPLSLVTLQEEKWAPLLKEVNSYLNLSLTSTFSLSLPSLLPIEEQRVYEFLDQVTDFKLAGFCHLLTLCSSFCLSYLVLEKRLPPDNAWEAAHLHEHTQRNLWGNDEEVLLQEKSQYEEFRETARFLALVG